ncbi:MAG: polysaccharide deacetylase family protein [Pseudomonadota bacterium]
MLSLQCRSPNNAVIQRVLSGARFAVCLCLAIAPTAAAACNDPDQAIGLSRVVEIDTSSGPLFGRITKFTNQPTFLKNKEIVLTFDDGPLPKVTNTILKTLADHCTRATFFPVGERAVQFPKTIRTIVAAGHTLGSHTWSHPRKMGTLKPGRARDEIERGFAAVALASGHAIAPFFRFTGLNDDRDLLSYTQVRKVGVFSVDIVSEDSYAKSTSELVRKTIARAERRKGGIVLFHDLKQVTARALPTILRELKARGFRVVHIVSTNPFRRDRGYDSVLWPRRARRLKSKPSSKGDQAEAIPAPPPILEAPPQDSGLAGIPRVHIRPIQRPFDRKAQPATARKPQPAASGRAWRTTIGKTQ